MSDWIYAGKLDELKQNGTRLVKGGIVVVWHDEKVYGVDNRCPHMGFPLQMGTVCDGILTCHWHHARFCIDGGGTLDPWADDVPVYETKLERDEVWVDPVPLTKRNVEKHLQRLKEGLEQNLSLVIAKSVVALVESGVPASEIVQVGIDYGTLHRTDGWGSGLTILTAMANVLPKLDAYGKILALFHGLVHAARDSSNRGTRFLLSALPPSGSSYEQLGRWYRQCVEVRDTQGAERLLLSAASQGITRDRMENMMMAAATDHFYLNGGHTLDFHNKAFESFEYANPDMRPQILTSLVPLLENPTRSEELHNWQSPVNLVKPLEKAFENLAEMPENASHQPLSEEQNERLFQLLLGDHSEQTIEEITRLLLNGASPLDVAGLTALAAAERIARFHTQNDFADWISVLHTFTHAHAVHQSLKRSVTREKLRAVYHAAASIYLDRFLNIPAAARPKPEKLEVLPQTDELLALMDSQQQVKQAAQWVVNYRSAGGSIDTLFQALGHALLREDAEFHSYQMFEAAVQEVEHWRAIEGAFAGFAVETLMIALTRYLAAHAPTARELPNIAKIAWRLHKGEKLFEESGSPA